MGRTPVKFVHCFEFAVEPNPAIEAERNAGKVAVTALAPQAPPKLGEELTFKFRIVDQATKKPVSGLTDVVILTFLAPGTWHRREVAKEEGDGVYSIGFNPPSRVYTMATSSAARSICNLATRTI